MLKFIIDDYLYDIIQTECPELEPKIIKFSSGLQASELDKVIVILSEEDFFYIGLKDIKLNHVSYCGDMDEDTIKIIEDKINYSNSVFLEIKNELCLFSQLSITIPLLEEVKSSHNVYNMTIDEIEHTIQFNKRFVDLYQTKIDDYLRCQNEVFKDIFDGVKFGKLGERIYE